MGTLEMNKLMVGIERYGVNMEQSSVMVIQASGRSTAY